MTRKGEIIESLIELSKHRRWAKQYAANVAAELGGKGGKAMLEYAREIDNGFALIVKAVQAVIRPRPRRPRNVP